jgi:hypothetical protein
MTNSSQIPPYTERVLPGLAYFASTSVIPVISYLVALPFGEFLSCGIALGLEAIIVLLGVVNAPTIAISSTELTVGRAKIDRKYVSAVAAIPPSESFVARGRGLDPRAYVRFQFGVKCLVKISLNDANDPTPYWLVSTRNPELVLQRLKG